MASNHSPWAAALLLLAAAIKPSAAAPSISFPLNSQVPPAARVGQPFSFVFSASTFSSASPMSYSLNNGPKWLSIDSKARRLYGTPGDGDIEPGQVVGVPIELVATDDNGPTTMSSTLVVSRNPSPSVHVPISNQIPNFGVFSGPDTILCLPDKSFTFSLADDTFSSPSGGGLNYYAVTDDNAPLPAWISFDPSKLSFAGTTPPLATLIQPPQSFGFQLLASDITGFSAASLSFSIVVGGHGITADQTTVQLNATVGSVVSYSGIRAMVKVDGQPAQDSTTIIATTDNLPDWLSLDKDTWEISGTPPKAANSTAFVVTLGDTFSDHLNITVSVSVAGGGSKDSSDVFIGSLPELDIVAGQHFSVNLSSYLADPHDADVSVSTNPALSWVKFDVGQNTISGDAPASLKDVPDGSLTIQVKSRTSGKTESKTLPLHIQAIESRMSSSRLSTMAGTPTSVGTSATQADGSPASASNSSDAEGDGPSDDSGGGPSRVTLVAILVPLLILASVLVTMLLCCLRRRRQRAAHKPKRADISGPLPGSFVMNAGAEETGPIYDLRKQYDIETPPKAKTRGAQGGHPEPTSRNQSESSIPPMPDMAKITALKNRIRSGAESRLNGSRTSWLAAAAVGVLKPGKQARKSKSRSYLSDTSLYPDPSDAADKNSLALLGNGSRTSFRDALEVNIPEIVAPSIQQTPDVAYSGPEGSIHQHDGFQGTFYEEVNGTLAALPERSLSRRTHNTQTSPGSKAWASWAKGSPGELVKTIKKQASILSMNTVDTFAHRKRAKVPGSPDLGDSDEDVLHIPRTRSTRPGNDPGAARAMSRKGPHARWFGSKTTVRTVPGPHGAEPHGPPSTAAVMKQSVDLEMYASPPRSPPRSPPEVPRDSLGISYSDLVNTSPFHPSRSWSTIHSASEERRVGAEMDNEMEPPFPDPPGANSQSNWAVVNESPIIKDWRGGDSTRADLMSPSRWPQAHIREPAGGRPGSSLSTSPPLGARANWAGTALSKRAQAAQGHTGGDNAVVDDGTRSAGGRERDFAVYI